MSATVQLTRILALQYRLKLGQAERGFANIRAQCSGILFIKSTDIDHPGQFAELGFNDIGPALRRTDHLGLLSGIQCPG
ncbi:hypothetical protein D3C81_1047830 [compost metagenome]